MFCNLKADAVGGCAILYRLQSAPEILSSPNMAVIWVNNLEDWGIMEAKKIKEFRRRLTNEHENLVKSVSRSRSAESEIGAVKTEDEGDLATISQEKDILSCLNESVFTRLKF